MEDGGFECQTEREEGELTVTERGTYIKNLINI